VRLKWIFRKVLQDKNATAKSVKQIIIDLKGAQGDMWSPDEFSTAVALARWATIR